MLHPFPSKACGSRWSVGLLTHRVILGPSSQIAVRFSDFVGVVSDYSGGAVLLILKVNFKASAFPKPESKLEFHTDSGDISLCALILTEAK